MVRFDGETLHFEVRVMFGRATIDGVPVQAGITLDPLGCLIAGSATTSITTSAKSSKRAIVL